MISVIIPAYNAAGFLIATMKSVLAQTYPEWELVVVNDGSKDNTEAVAKAIADLDPRVRVFTKENGGCAAARNYGLEQANPASEYILFLDHDDLWETSALDTLLKVAQAQPDCVGTVGDAQIFSDAQTNLSNLDSSAAKESPPQRKTPLQETIVPITFEDMVMCNRIMTMGQVLMRRTALEAAGPLDPQTAPVDDWDIYLRLTRIGPLAATSLPVISWRQHATNTSKNKQMMQQAEEYVRQKLLASPDLTSAQRQFATQCFEKSRRNLSLLQFEWAKECLSRKQYRDAIRQTRYALANFARSLTGK